MGEIAIEGSKEKQMSELYLSPAGNDTNPGTFAAPLATLEAAYNLLPDKEGGTITLRGGLYLWSGANWYKSGNPGCMLRIRSHPGETAILDNSPRKTDAGRGQFSLYGSFLQFEGLVFQNAYCIHQQEGPIAQNFIGCTIRNLLNQGIVGGGTNCQYVGNWIDNCGGGGKDPSQALYLNGAYCTVRDNLITRLTGQYAMQLYPGGLCDSIIENNVLVGNPAGILVMGTGTVVQKNILIESGALSTLQDAHRFRFIRNYIERQHAGHGIVLVSANLTPGDFSGGFVITDNTVNNANHEPNAHSICLTGKLDGPASVIDRNTYIGPTFIGRTETFNPYVGTDYMDLPSWRAAIAGYNPAWEVNSRHLPLEYPFPRDIAALLSCGDAEKIKRAAREHAQV